jgi:predicted nucleic acid-binding protein
VVAADPDDDRFLELAVDGRADLVVSGDPHLLRLGAFSGIPVVTPADAAKTLGLQSGSKP